MLPYPINTITLFGYPVGLFTLLVALSIIVGTLIMDREMERLGFSGKESSKIILGILISGLYTSHFVALFFYNFDRLGEAGLMAYIDPLNGMSSTGGFLGAAVSFLFMKRWIKGQELQVKDAAVWSLVMGWGLARLACTMAFDHPGSLSGFFLAFDHPVGGPRHNLGFYEMLYTLLVLVPAAWYLKKRHPPPGSQVALVCLLYAPARFLMDFLRATDLVPSDVRYYGLTFAQYATVFLLLAGIWLVTRIRGQDIPALAKRKA